MLKDFHQHQEPPPGPGRNFSQLPFFNIRMPFSRQQLVILLLSVTFLVFLINLWFSLRRPKLRRLAKVEVVQLQDSLVRQQLEELDIQARREFLGGVNAYAKSHWSLAEKHFLSVLQQAPDHPTLHALIGLVMLYGNRTDEAIFHLKLAARSDSALREAVLWNLAQAYLMEARAEQAEFVLQQLAELNGQFALRAREQLQMLRD